MKKILASLALAVALTGCATIQSSPKLISMNSDSPFELLDLCDTVATIYQGTLQLRRENNAEKLAKVEEFVSEVQSDTDIPEAVRSQLIDAVRSAQRVDLKTVKNVRETAQEKFEACIKFNASPELLQKIEKGR